MPSCVERVGSCGNARVNKNVALAQCRKVGSSEGLFVAPEAAACFAALKSLRYSGKIRSGERVVIFNTSSGIKYLDRYQEQNQSLSSSLIDEDGDSLGESLRGLSIETSSEFE